MKKIRSYEFLGKLPRIDELTRLFPGHLSKYHVPYFTTDSEAEKSFLRYCEDHDYRLRKKTILAYEYGVQDDVTSHLYLSVKDDLGLCIAEPDPSFIDFSSACPGGGSYGVCNRGAKIAGEPTVSEPGLDRLEALDIVMPRLPTAPKLYLLSDRLARILTDAKATGCSINRCKIRPPSSRRCFELRITGRALGVC